MNSERNEYHITCVAVGNECLALVTVHRYFGLNTESRPVWIEIRFKDGHKERIDQFNSLHSRFSAESLRRSISHAPSDWGLIVSCIASTPSILRDRNLPGYTRAYRSIDLCEMFPWADGQFLYFLGAESIVDSPDASVVAFRMSTSTFKLASVITASIADLQSGNAIWPYSRKDIESLFDCTVTEAQL